MGPVTYFVAELGTICLYCALTCLQLTCILHFTPDESKRLLGSGQIRLLLFYRWGNCGSSEFKEFKGM